MNDRHDLELLLGSGVPIIVVQTEDEARFLKLLTSLSCDSRIGDYRPLFRWSVTDGLQRLDLDLQSQRSEAEPTMVLKTIRAAQQSARYALLDFHPFLDDPVNTRLLKDIAIASRDTGTVILLISHRIEIPAELESFAARFEMQLPNAESRLRIVERLIAEYKETQNGRPPVVDPKALELLIGNLGGLSHTDVERLARNAIWQDGAIDADDLPAVTQAKYRLLNKDGILSFEYDTTPFSDIAGFRNVKVWLKQRESAFAGNRPQGLDPPKGILLLGVQGCGKSLVAKAAASIFGVPLLRLDFGALYNKYHGETERNLRESLNTAEIMSPCVLWLDEIEKGLSSGNDDSATSKRVLGSFLTWMAERQSDVLLVATANDVRALPPELIRKGRFDEIFFVDLPNPTQRADIWAIHLRKRGLKPEPSALAGLVDASDNFSGAEIEQCVVAALYAAHAIKQNPSTQHLLAELKKTRPLAVMMQERVAELKAWAKDRTVPAD